VLVIVQWLFAGDVCVAGRCGEISLATGNQVAAADVPGAEQGDFLV